MTLGGSTRVPRGRLPARLLAAIVLLQVCFGHRSAEAKASAEAACSLRQAYSTALRYLRVDKGFVVLEKDAEAGYLLFSYPEASRREGARGAIELVELSKAIRIVVSIQGVPAYHEQVLKQQLLMKLRAELPRSVQPPQEPGSKGEPPSQK